MLLYEYVIDIPLFGFRLRELQDIRVRHMQEVCRTKCQIELSAIENKVTHN